MKNLLFAILCACSFTASAQAIIGAGCGEYGVYLLRKSDSAIYEYYFSNTTHQIALTANTGVKFAQASGGLYSGMGITSAGLMYELAQGAITPIAVPTDTLGHAYTGNISCTAYFFTYVTAKNDGTGWITGNDVWNFASNGTAVYSKPTQIKNPASGSVRYIKFASGAVLLGLTDNGKVYRFNGNSGVPTLVNLPKPATDIAAGRQGQCYAIVPVDTAVTKAYGSLYGWGDGGANPGQFMGQISGTVSNPTNMSAQFSAQLTYPISTFATNENNSQFIDTAHRMFAIGNNSPPGMGNGYELVNHAEIYNNPSTGATPYVWDWAFQPGPTTRFLTAPVQVGVGTKWKTVFSGNSYCFYFYATDTNDSVYSWGREKSFVDGSGRTTTGTSEANYPNFMDRLVPTMIHPFITPVFGISNGQDVTLYSVSAGQDKVVNLPSSSVVLSGAYTPSTSYTASSYLWTQLSGPAWTLTSANTLNCTVSNLSSGVGTFKLLVTDNNTATIADTVIVTVNASAGNVPPTINPGSNQTINIPLSVITLAGSAIASGNQGATITSYSWIQKGGPTTTSITNASQPNTQVSGLSLTGTYTFSLTATDNNGLSNSATMTVTVVTPTKCGCLNFKYN